MTLIIVMEIVLLLSLMQAASLLQAVVRLRIAQNYRLSVATFYIAEAGLQHALALFAPDDDFYYGADFMITDFAFRPGYKYSVLAHYDASGLPRLTSYGFGPRGAQKTVVGYLGRDEDGKAKITAWAEMFDE